MSNQRHRGSAPTLGSLCPGWFVCCRCGSDFQSHPPPAETRADDPSPMCDDCLCKELDEAEPIPMSREEIDSIVARVTGRTK